MKNKKLWIRVLLILLALVAVGISVFVVFVLPKMEEGLEKLDSLEFGALDLDDTPDGSYEGSYEAGIVSAQVRVNVKDHRITDVEILKHNHGKGGAAESIVGSVVSNQSLQVDVISGATYSSKVILAAIEKALKE